MVSSIYSTSAATSSAIKGISGLASGINTEEMIESMTAVTKAKIAKVLQKQTSTGWKMEAYQSMTSLLIDFREKYMNLTSLTNMKNASFFQSATITSAGKNASAVSMMGTPGAGLSSFSVRSIDQLATTEAFTSTKSASQNSILSKDISGYITNGVLSSKLEGEAINLEVNGVRYNVYLENIDAIDVTSDADARTNAESIIKAINSGIETAGISGRVRAELGADGKVQLKTTANNGDSVEVIGVGTNIMNYIGLGTGAKATDGVPMVANLDITTQARGEDLIKTDNFNETLYDKSITFNLNGTSKTIKFDKAEIETAYGTGGFTDVDDLVEYLDDKLNTAFNGKVSIANDNGRLSFTTPDATSILSVASGTAGLLGPKGILGLELGAANRLLLGNRALSDTNLNADAAAFFNTAGFLDGTAGVDMQVNDTKFTIYKNRIVSEAGTEKKTYDFTAGTTMRDVMNTVNSADAGVRMTYNSTTDSFSVVATETGTMGRAEVTGNFADALFGDSTLPSGTAGARITQQGVDAQLTVSFDGGVTTTSVTRSSNSFSLNGMNLTLNSTFAAGTGEEVTFSAKANTDAIVDAVKEMVTSYNDIILKVNTALSAKPDRDHPYLPLTSEQRKEMSESEIEDWEEKAKETLLYSDSVLQSLATDIRFAFAMPVGDLSLSQIGINSSTNWRDNGKLIIDEAALRQAIESDAEKVADIFTRASTGAVTASSRDAGVMSRVDAVMNKYVNTVGTNKGLLIAKAGHESSPISLLDSALYGEYERYESQLEALREKLDKEYTRYAKQFASLETFISKMNAQSGSLSQMLSSDY